MGPLWHLSDRPRCLIVAGMAGWRGYEYWVAKAAAAGAEFEAAIALSEQGKQAEAEAAFARVSDRGAGRLSRARAHARGRRACAIQAGGRCESL